MSNKSDRIELNQSRQRIAIALFQHRQKVLDEANRVLNELQAAIDELATIYAGKAGWEFAQDENGALYLRPQKQTCEQS